MRLQLATWPEVEAYLTRSQGIVIPIGSTEQHGPTGFVGTDALCPELIAHGIGEKLGYGDRLATVIVHFFRKHGAGNRPRYSYGDS